MLARRQEINTQVQQIIDAFLLALTLFVTHYVRERSVDWFGVEKTIDPFSNYHWLIVVVMAFGPIVLELQGFYESPITKTKWKSFRQIVQAMVYLGIVVSVCVIFLRLPLANRSVPLLYLPVATAVLLIKERIIVHYVRRRAARGELRERVLLAGTPEDIAALERSFTPEQKLLMVIADRIDIEKQPISDLVEALHRHSITRVLFAAGHTQL